MAKPKHGRWNSCPRQSFLSPDSRTRPHSHASSRPLPRSPSPAVLSALAVIAATPSVVAGSPLPRSPPSFLCPFIERDSIAISPNVYVQPPPPTSTPVPSTSTTSSSPSPTPRANQFQRHVIADRFVEGSDNLWRKTDAWTLYGSTHCSASTAASTPSSQSQPIALQTSAVTSPSPSTTPAFDAAALPAGWDNSSSSSSNTESTIILALAIVLAGSICVFMIGCLVWRRRKKRMKDIERKLGKKHSADDDSRDTEQEQDTQGRMRMWAKASARWKSNIRQSARRRRKRPLGTSTVNRPTSPTYCDPQVTVVSPSRRSSFAAEESGPSRLDVILRLDDDSTETPAVQHDLPRAVSPPTYGASLASRFLRPPSSTVSNPSPTPPDLPHPAQLGDHSSFKDDDEPLPYLPRSDGHVATDDKAQLAHIRLLASSPPAVRDAIVSADTIASVSAPEWHEVENDDLENLGTDTSDASIPFHNFGLPPSFPSPPSKVDVSLGYLEDQPLRYGEGGDILESLPISGPSGSSFGAFPSAPPIDYPGLEPSAPSLEGEDDSFRDWDGQSSYVPELPTSVVEDSSPVCESEPSTPPSISVISPLSFLPSRRPAPRDSVLPQYHP